MDKNPDSLKECRNKIDEIDDKIVDLFARRMDVAAEIAAVKKAENLPVFDPRREREKLKDVISKTPDGLKDDIAVLYPLIFELSRNHQRRVSGERSELAEKIEKAVAETPALFPENAVVACQGTEGSNSQTACDRLFRRADIMFFSTFEAVFRAIETGFCRYGVIPVENSTAGSGNSGYDLMMNHRFTVSRSVRIKVDHNLLAVPGTKIENIKEIYSHEQAINQCSEFLSEFAGVNVKIIPCENTAVAAKMVAESGRRDVAALASRSCVKLYGLECLRESVQNADNNYTRFVCISRNLEIFPGADRTSVMLTLPHEAGSLYKLMSKFYALGINLTKLESRPLPGRDFEFMFYFDFETPVYSPRLLRLLGELPDACESFTYLGSYSEVV
ncbi:MAG: chorismate mutase [Clostridia bacterium]|nr:chorismate mutase [Clostridia bacterium]